LYFTLSNLNTMNKSTLFLFPLLLAIWVFGCNNQSANDPEQETPPVETPDPDPVLNYGFVDGNTYSNDYFGLKISVPESWTIQSREESALLENLGRQNSSQTGESQPASTPIEELQVIYLLVALQFEAGTAVDYNPGVQIIANNLSESDTVVTGELYLQKLADQLSRFPNFTLAEGGISTATIGGKELATVEAETKVGEVSVKQSYFATVIKEYAIQFTISYTNDAEKEALMNVLNTTVFE
jgi:hypothetical protein